MTATKTGAPPASTSGNAVVALTPARGVKSYVTQIDHKFPTEMLLCTTNATRIILICIASTC